VYYLEDENTIFDPIDDVKAVDILDKSNLSRLPISEDYYSLTFTSYLVYYESRISNTEKTRCT